MPKESNWNTGSQSRTPWYLHQPNPETTEWSKRNTLMAKRWKVKCWNRINDHCSTRWSITHSSVQGKKSLVLVALLDRLTDCDHDSPASGGSVASHKETLLDSHSSRRVCGHIWVTCLLCFCVQLFSTCIDPLLPFISMIYDIISEA